MKEYSSDYLLSLLPLPADTANKYSRGKLVLVAGSRRYTGAACLAAFASQRAGVGYTEVVTHPDAITVVQNYRPSLVVKSSHDKQSWEVLTSHPEKPCAYVMGSGFDPADEKMGKLTYHILGRANAPILLDGGAFDWVSRKKGQDLCKERFISGLTTVLTPHFGEATRLAEPFGLAADDPKALSLALSQAYGVIVVLKGSTTFISDGDSTYAMTLGTAALAKAGTGDVLAGIIGALLAQGLESIDACVLGSTLHARAGNIAAQAWTSIGVTAEDVIDCIPSAFEMSAVSNSEEE